jgi:hypothetical protein
MSGWAKASKPMSKAFSQEKPMRRPMAQIIRCNIPYLVGGSAKDCTPNRVPFEPRPTKPWFSSRQELRKWQ